MDCAIRDYKNGSAHHQEMLISFPDGRPRTVTKPGHCTPDSTAEPEKGREKERERKRGWKEGGEGGRGREGVRERERERDDPTLATHHIHTCVGDNWQVLCQINKSRGNMEEKEPDKVTLRKVHNQPHALLPDSYYQQQGGKPCEN